MRFNALLKEYERAITEQSLRLVLFRAPRGMGRTVVLRAFSEELKTHQVEAQTLEAERLGDFDGAGLDALLRAHLDLPVGADEETARAAIDTAFEGVDGLGREFLSIALGHDDRDYKTRRLDAGARWEGVAVELDKRLVARRTSPFVLLLDDAPAADRRTLEFISLLAGRAWTSPGLIVLSAREDQLQGSFDNFLKPLKNLGKLSEVSLAPPELADLAKRWAPDIVDACRGNPLYASLIASGLAPKPWPLTLDQTMTTVAQALPESQRDVLDAVSLVGGRGPLMLVALMLGRDVQEDAQALAALGLVSVSQTRPFAPDEEVFVRYPKLVSTRRRAALASRDWQELAMAWCDGVIVAAGANWPSRAPRVSQVLVWTAEALNIPSAASYGRELVATATQDVAALRRAEADAQGVRKLVLCRRLADDLAFAGDPSAALAVVNEGLRASLATPGKVPSGWTQALFPDGSDELDRWDHLDLDPAVAALELSRAEVLSHLARSDDTRKAFLALEERLTSLRGAAASALWMRWARTWTWYNAEILADGAEAQRVCALVRKKVPQAVLSDSVHAVAFLRAEQVAASRTGDNARARELADELIAVAQSRGDSREECVAWNARALLDLRDGELRAARAGFEKSLDLARAIGYRRREAIALHNLGLVLFQLGEYGAALACQDKYVSLSDTIGNHVARAYGPAAMAAILLQQGDDGTAQPLIAQARTSAEENEWPMLVAWTRFLAGQSRLLSAVGRRDTLRLSQARADFMACLDILQDKHAGWSEEVDPAEVISLLVLAYQMANNKEKAAAHLVRARDFVDGSPASARWVSAAEDVLAGRSPDAALAWFEAHGYQRAVHLWMQLLPALRIDVEARL